MVARAADPAGWRGRVGMEEVLPGLTPKPAAQGQSREAGVDSGGGKGKGGWWRA